MSDESLSMSNQSGRQEDGHSQVIIQTGASYSFINEFGGWTNQTP